MLAAIWMPSIGIIRKQFVQRRQLGHVDPLPHGWRKAGFSRGTAVVYAERFVPDIERERAREQGDEPNAIPFLKRFTVFNTDQCDGPTA